MSAIARYRLPLLLAIAPVAAALLAVVFAGSSPMGAQAGSEPDQQVIADVWGYARETGNGFEHVLRWMRVLKTLGAIDDMTAAEAQGYAGQYLAERWNPVAGELRNLEADGGYQPDEQVVSDVWGYARETNNGFEHVLRWMRALKTLGAIDDMTSAEAQGYAEQYLAERWEPVVEELSRLEASASEPEATPEPTPEPNRAPEVNEEGEWHGHFTGRSNAPRGVLVWKIFEGIFTDPDGDELTYSASAPAEHSALVEVVQINLDVSTASGRNVDVLFFRYDADDDWKSVSPALSDPLVTEVTLTATDPGGLTASVSGEFIAWWDVPAQPRGFRLETGPGEFEVRASWDSLDGWGIGEYRLSWRREGGEYEVGDALSLSTHSATVEVSGIGVWEMRLEACNDLGCSPGVTERVSVGVEPPGEPQNFALSVEAGSLEVSAVLGRGGRRELVSVALA